MANLLLTATSWDDVWPYDSPPPNSWNGTTYHFIGDEFATTSFTLAPSTSAPTPQPEDVVAGSIVASNYNPFDEVSLPMYLVYMDDDTTFETYDYVDLSAVDEFSFTAVDGAVLVVADTPTPGGSGATFYYGLNVEITPTDTPTPPTNEYYVYEMEKGWSFDGNYIPHFLELNWLFQEDPFTYKSINKIRVHGLTKGVVNLQVSLSGMQGDPATDYIQDYMDPQFIDLPFTPIYVSSDFVSATNYTPYSDRGMALQMKFEGRNTARLLPEPAHVLQVLALQGTPSGNGARAQ